MSGEPARRCPPCPAAAGCFYFDITLGEGRRVRCVGQEGAGALAQPPLVQPLAAGGRWALRAPLPTCFGGLPGPTPAGRAHDEGCAQKGRFGLSSKTLPGTSRDVGTRAQHMHAHGCLFPALIQSAQSHATCTSCKYPLAHGVDGHPQAGGLGHT